MAAPGPHMWAQLGVWDDPSALRSPTNEEDVHVPLDPRPLPQEVLDIDQAVTELELRLAELKVERSHVMAKRALVRRLPAEILARVFELGVHESPALPVSVSLVSRHWRELALNTSSLWSYIVLDGEWGYGRASHILRMRKFACYLDRSMASKLWIDLDLRYLDELEEARDIMNLLEPHLSRCFYFHMYVPEWDWMVEFQNHCNRLRDCVEEMSLRIDPSDGPSDNSEEPVFLTGEYSRLCTLKLEQTPLNCVRAELSALRKLHLARDPRHHSSSPRLGLYLRVFLNRLREASTIEDIRMESIQLLHDGTEDIFHISPRLLPLPNLTHLSLCCVDSSSIVLLADSLSFPVLHRLSVHVDNRDSHTDHGVSGGAAMHWLPRISLNSAERMPLLRQLDLRAVSVDGAATLPPFIRGLHQLPQITGLSISSPHGGAVGTKFFNLMARDLGRSGEVGEEGSSHGVWLLPRLEALCLRNCADVVGYEVLEIVRARASAREGVFRAGKDVVDLRYLKIEQCYAFEQEVLDLLRPMVDTIQIA